MKIVFFGHQTIGCACLDVLLELQQEIVGVVTDKADPETSGWFDSLDAHARIRGLPTLTFDGAGRTDIATSVRALQPEFLLACDFPHHLDRELLSLPGRGSVNVYNTLLPAFRGLTPHIWAVRHGALTSGVTLHEITPGAEGVLAQEPVPIAWNDTAFDLYRRQAVAAAELLRRTLPLILSGEVQRQPLEPATDPAYGPLRPEDCEIDWHNSGRDIYNLVRAVTYPYPGAGTEFRGRRCIIWRADSRPSPLLKKLPPPGSFVRLSPVHVMTGNGLLILRRLQLEGEPELDAEIFIRRHRVTSGERFSA